MLSLMQSSQNNKDAIITDASTDEVFTNTVAVSVAKHSLECNHKWGYHQCGVTTTDAVVADAITGVDLIFAVFLIMQPLMKISQTQSLMLFITNSFYMLKYYC